MGSVSIVIIFFCILIFHLILFVGSSLFSFFFSRSGRDLLYRDFYECGFKPVSDNVLLLDIQFSTVGLIFLVYEMEIVLFVPLFLNFFSFNFIYVFISLISLFTLGLSYLYEWERCGFDWSF